MKILIVDDKQENCYLLETLLRPRGHEIQVAGNGEVALDHLRRAKVDLIISDILMPVMDGFQLCRKVKTDEALREIPFIIYTATYTGRQDEAFAMKIGADRFIEKPCEPDVLIRAVEDVGKPGGNTRKTTAAATVVHEEEALKLYNERLVRKLEQKVLEAENEIRAREEAEKALRESRARLLEAQRLAKMGDFTWDSETGEVTWSEPLYDLLGYDFAEKIDFRMVNEAIHHPEDLARITAWLKEAIESGRDSLPPNEYRLVKKDGTPIFVRTVGTILRRPGRKPTVFATIQDLTERWQAEERLKESESRFRLFADTAPVGVVIADKNQNAVYVSPKFISLFGYTLQDIPTIGDWMRLAYPDTELRARVYREWHEAVQEARREKREIAPLEYPVTCSDGRVRDIEFRMSTTGDLDFVVFTDITGRKRAESDREKLQEQLFQARKMESIGRLAGGVAHDFNNMLSVILGYTELALGEVQEGSALHGNLREVHNAAMRSAEITRQLLAYARKQTIAPRVLDLNAAIDDLLKMLRRLIGEQVELCWLPGPNLPSVRMDPSQIDQLLVNLCVNARDAIAGTGTIVIETRTERVDEAFCHDRAGLVPGTYLTLSVADNGCGMDGKTIEHLFEPFFTTKELGKGTGLGLSTVYGIVKQNNGYIDVSSQPGRGTRFTIYIPPELEDRHSAAAGPVEQAMRGQGETVLLVEDEAAILKLGSSLLKQLGYKVLQSNGPEGALRLAEDVGAQVALLITDVTMPVMNGRELAARMVERFPNLKTLYMSGYSASVIAEQGVIEEGVNFIQKPFTISELATKVRAALGR